MHGAYIENKGVSISYHYNEVPEVYQEELTCQARKIIRSFGFIANEAKKVIEGQPPVDWNKGFLWYNFFYLLFLTYLPRACIQHLIKVVPPYLFYKKNSAMIGNHLLKWFSLVTTQRMRMQWRFLFNNNFKKITNTSSTAVTQRKCNQF